MRASLVALPFAIVTLFAGAVWAGDPPPDSIALAEQLFIDAKKLMGQGDYGAACPKLVESQRLDPAGGTILTLALCHQAEGRTATAWAEFKTAIDVARRDGRPDREALAKDRVAELEPKLCRLVIALDESAASLEGLVVTRDGVVVERASLDLAAPVDPGKHVVRAEAKGKRPLEIAVTIESEGAVERVVIGGFRDVSVEPPPLAPKRIDPPVVEAPPPQGPSPLVVTGAVIGVAGLGFLAGATYAALDAASKQSEAEDTCPDTVCDDERAVQLNEAAGTGADIATGLFTAGGLHVATSVALIIVGFALPRPKSSQSARVARYDRGVSFSF